MATLRIDIKTSGVKQVKDLERNLQALDKQSNKNISTTNSLSSTLKTFAGVAVIGYAIKQTLDLAKAFINTADEMSQLNSRLKLVTSGTQEYTKAQSELFRISQDSRNSLASTMDLYTRLERSTGELNISQERLFNVTESISKALVVSGASAQSSSAALFQLGQGLSAGALRGDELNSVLEQTPRLAQAIAQGMSVSIGELRALGAEGALTAEKVIKALESQAQALNEEFKGIAVTAESGYTTLENSVLKTISLLNEQYEITESIGYIFISLGQVATDVLSQIDFGLGKSTDKVGDFGLMTLEATKSIISSLGYAYDSLETFGDYFGVVGAIAKLAFAGVATAVVGLASGVANTFEGIVDGINWAFEKLVNGIVDSINWVLDMAAELGWGSGGTIGHISLGKIDVGGADLSIYTKAAVDTTKEAATELAQAYEDLMSTGKGQAFAEDINIKLDEAYKKLIDSKAEQGEKTPFVAPSMDTAKLAVEDIPPLVETKNTIEDTNTSLDDLINNMKDTNSMTKEFNDNFYNDDDSFYENLINTNDTTKDFTDTIQHLDTSFDNAIDTVETFIFQFSNVFINSIKNNISQLQSVAGATDYRATISYADALAKAADAQNYLISNPYDVQIGKVFTNAYSQFIDSADAYLSDPTSFGTLSEYQFAKSTVGTQATSFQNTAQLAGDTLTVLENLYQLINQAFADGILTDEEKATIATVADNVNAKNDLLLGSNGAVALTTNSVKSSVNALSGGYSIGNLKTVSDTIAQYSGLTKNEVSNVYSATSGLNSGINATNSSVNSVNSSIGTSNIKLSSIDSKSGKIKRVVSQGGWVGSDGYYTNNTLDRQFYQETMTYHYYAKGGFTGYGQGKRDETGHKQAGIVHEGEWVAPKWMVNSQPGFFSMLDGMRSKGTFSNGGYSSQSVNVVQSQTGNNDMMINSRLTNIENILNRVTAGGDTMQVSLVG